MLACLTTVERLRLGSASTEWMAALDHPSLWTDLSFPEAGAAARLDDQVLVMLCDRFDVPVRCRTLSLVGCTSFT